MSSLIAFSQVTPTAPTSLDEVPASRSRSRHRSRELARSLTLAAAATCALVVMIAPQASAAQRVKVLPGFNGTVNAISEPDSNGTRYIGGAFTAYNALDTGYGAVADTTSAAIQTQFPKVSGGVLQAVAADGSGGWYIGGSFTSVDGVTRNRAAHINSDGSLDSNWNPNLSASVRALAVSGSTVYLGGDFPTVGSSTRNYAAAVSISDTGNGSGGSCITSYAVGCRMSWNPNLNNAVYALAVSGTTVYLGGNFSTVGGTSRTFAAAVSISDTGNGSGGSCTTSYADQCLRSWDPNVSASVRALAVSGSTVYLGGFFTTATTAGGTNTRNYAAAVSTDGTLQSWNPNLNSAVSALAVSGSTVYLGGAFNYVGATTARNYAAAVSTDGTLQSWNPNLDSAVSALAVSGSTVYLGGSFTTVGGTARNRAAAIATDGTLQSWNPNMNDQVSALAVSDSNVYLGGFFSTVGGTTRNRIAAIGTDGTLSSTWGAVIASPTLDTSAATITRGAVVKGDAATPAGSTPGSYKWQRCTSSSSVDCSDISGGGSTGAWWGSRNADIGNRVRLKAVWDTIDSTITAFSTITGVFTPASTSAPTINQGLVSGAPRVGTSIHSSFGVWSGYRAGLTTVTFQWQRCTTTDASSCTTNIGTSSQWYRPVAADVGNYLRVTATLTTNGQSATASSAVTNQVASNLAGRRAHTAVRQKAPRHKTKAH